MSLQEPGIGPQGGNERRLRDTFGRFATGVTVVTARSPDGKLRGVTVNSFSAVSLDPPLVLWSLRRNAPSLADFAASSHFAVNVLSAEQAGIAQRFAQAHSDKFQSVAWAPGLGGCPLIDGALATFECIVERQIEGGDHVIFLGRVGGSACRDGDPLVFNAGRYCTIAPLLQDERVA
jgi:flavin reductase (DIM6/NTAB) family NADH-FMN oxidoreductase RutF